MICPNCRTPNNDQANNCLSCGYNLRSSSTGQYQVYNPYPSPVVPDVGLPAKSVFEYAGFWRRFAAYIIDSLILGVCFGTAFFIMILVIGIGSPTMTNGYRDFEDNTVSLTMFGAMVVFIIVFVIVEILYFAVMESSDKQATLGKMTLGIKVTNLSGGRISFVNALGRYFAKIISRVIIYVGYIMIGFTRQKQGLHDIIASTLVISNKPPTSAGNKNPPVYP